MPNGDGTGPRSGTGRRGGPCRRKPRLRGRGLGLQRRQRGRR